MSNRALRKVHGTKDDISSLASILQLDEENEETDTFNVERQRKKKATNLFDLLNEADASDHSQKSETKDNTEEEEEVKEEEIIQHTGTRPKNKQKKKKKHYQHQTVDNSDEEFFLHETNDNGSKQRNPASLKLPAKKCTLSLDQKHLNPDNELKKIFGSRVVQVNQKKSKGASLCEIILASCCQAKLGSNKKDWPLYGVGSH